MTEYKDKLTNEKTTQEIEQLKLENEQLRLQAENASLQMRVDNIKLVREIELTTASTAKTYKELRWYEISIIVAAVLAIVAVTKLVLS